MEDTTEEKKSLGMRRCKSAMLAREIPPTKTTARKTAERLVFDEASDQILVTEVLKDEEPSRLRRCKSVSGYMFVPDASDKNHALKLRRCKSFVERPTTSSSSDDDCQHGLHRCTSTA